MGGKPSSNEVMGGVTVQRLEDLQDTNTCTHPGNGASCCRGILESQWRSSFPALEV